MSLEYDHYSKEFQSLILALLIHYPEDSLSLIDPSYSHFQCTHKLLLRSTRRTTKKT